MEGATPTLETEYRMLHKDGAYKWILCRGIAVFARTAACAGLPDRKPTSPSASWRTAARRRHGRPEIRAGLEKCSSMNLTKKTGAHRTFHHRRPHGLYNHRFIQERFEFEFKRVRRYGGNLSCMMIDIDHFKMLNDTYGHQCGDFVLRNCRSFSESIRARLISAAGTAGGIPYPYQCRARIHHAVRKQAPCGHRQPRVHVRR